MADWRGRKVVDSEGAKIGKLESVYLDRETDTEKWGLVKPGLFGGRRLVPLADASPAGAEVKVPVSKKSVKAAPKAEATEEISPRQEMQHSEHYGLGRADGRGAPERPGPDRHTSERPERSETGRGDAGEQSATARQRERGARGKEREEFGGFKFGAVLFGWLVSIGISVLLTALAGAITGLVGAGAGAPAPGSVGVAAIVSAAIVLLILAIAYYAGGYVAGRMARFNGPKQGFGVWLIGVVATIIFGLAGALLGTQYNVLAQLKLPPIPVDAGSLTIVGLIALAAFILVTLLAAVGGGKAGTRYHRKIDRVAFSS